MIRFVYIIFFLNLTLNCVAQNDSINLYYKNFASGYFTNLDSAYENAEKVFYIDVSRKDLRVISDDFTKFKNIQILQLFSCNIESITEKIGELKDLERIDLSFNSIKTIPISIINLKKLKILDLSHNQIQKLPKEVYELESLETLVLSNNPITFFEKRRIIKRFKGKKVSIVFKDATRRKGNNGNDDRVKRKKSNKERALY